MRESASDIAEANHIQSFRTPALYIDEVRMNANINSMAHKAAQAGVRLRPHAKTHKSPAIALKQLKAGACGLTVATIDEAQAFIMAGIDSILLGYPQIHKDSLRLILQTARQYNAHLILTIDGAENLAAAQAVAAEMQLQLDVYLKVDVGLGRCGIDPSDPAALDLVRRILAADRLKLIGLMSHAGHAYAATSVEEIKTIAETERTTMSGFRQKCQAVCEATGTARAAKLQVSVGSTPTLLVQENFDGIDEIRPGNYVFQDLTMTSLGVSSLANCALAVLTRVVSLRPNQVIVDAGSKALSSDQGAHGSGNLSGFGLAVPLAAHLQGDYANTAAVLRLSEEHGFVERSAGINWRVGMLLAVIPNHACAAANLGPSYHLVREGKTLLRWPVAARRNADWDLANARPEA